MNTIKRRTVIVGSGCAAWSAACWLFDMGERDFVLVTENVNAGTSRNTGSDKQTYYKLSLGGGEGDSIRQMAQDLVTGSDVDGDIALCEAANSARCFYRLVSLGVPFPHNEFGEYVGYQTDHDYRARATSAGPLTSRFMTEALEKSAREKQIEIINHTLAFDLIADQDGVKRLDCVNVKNNEMLSIECAHVILCTGGPAHIYLDSVFPVSQHGMSALALRAGAKGANLQHWQYGLASTKFRWNVSGSYQQALPRFVSVDQEGVEREFLLDSLSSEEAINLSFLKGYQWPFDETKVQGSSQIDLLVKQETDYGRKVYMDYTRNPSGLTKAILSPEAHAYLQKCGALQATPIERLRAINPPAIDLYRSHQIDLATEMLEIKVCAQHHNGGIRVNANWQTDVDGLYVCGEAAGTFGKVRPGGSALNSTQVGSLRAAQHIAYESKREWHAGTPSILPLMLPVGDVDDMTIWAQKSMTKCAAIVRDVPQMKEHLAAVEQLLQNDMPIMPSDATLIARLKLRDLLETQQRVLNAMIYEREHQGEGVLVTSATQSSYQSARPIPDGELWFETAWRTYRETYLDE